MSGPDGGDRCYRGVPVILAVTAICYFIAGLLVGGFSVWFLG